MSENAHAEAVERLKQFGLSTYAAHTFTALVELGSGSAGEVSDAANVPRMRVYDAAEELRERGLVAVEETTPKRFYPVSAETASRTLEREFLVRIDDSPTRSGRCRRTGRAPTRASGRSPGRTPSPPNYAG